MSCQQLACDHSKGHSCGPIVRKIGQNDFLDLFFKYICLADEDRSYNEYPDYVPKTDVSESDDDADYVPKTDVLEADDDADDVPKTDVSESDDDADDVPKTDVSESDDDADDASDTFPLLKGNNKAGMFILSLFLRIYAFYLPRPLCPLV
ncbi:hypothetical protein DPMN_075640 [Dreissena polymorpha]|uniref:Uncharacterized protein n=1 Tax=Dreissena polymorpha TaxID=45954 RepID=A0A9D3YM37_DREPO|nr:hypothetical protein DPMN_075640 [Dreissena polymorpha]